MWISAQRCWCLATQCTVFADSFMSSNHDFTTGLGLVWTSEKLVLLWEHWVNPQAHAGILWCSESFWKQTQGAQMTPLTTRPCRSGVLMRLSLLFHLQMCKTKSHWGTANLTYYPLVLPELHKLDVFLWTWKPGTCLLEDKLYEHIQKRASSPRAVRHMMTAGIYPALTVLVLLVTYQQLKAQIVVHSASAFQANNH